MTLTARIGIFLFFLGFLAMVLFIAGYRAAEPQFSFLCSGVFLIFLGVYMFWKYRNPPPPSNRFATYRKFRDRKNVKEDQGQDK